MPELKELDLYGSTLKDFSPLAAVPKLEKLTYYATKDADFGNLGKLTNVKYFHGGLTSLADISWVANVPNLRKLDLFSESVRDYTPLAKTKVEDLQIWSMKVPADLRQLSGVTSLKTIKLWSLKLAGGYEGLSSLINLEELLLYDMNAKDGTPVDLAFIRSLINLKMLDLNRSEITNFDAVAACTKLEKVIIESRSTGVTSLGALKKLPNLKELTVGRGKFSDAELAGFATGVKIIQR
jgi:Leucine-rich repeat (LRR) protein